MKKAIIAWILMWVLGYIAISLSGCAETRKYYMADYQLRAQFHDPYGVISWIKEKEQMDTNLFIRGAISREDYLGCMEELLEMQSIIQPLDD